MVSFVCEFEDTRSSVVPIIVQFLKSHVRIVHPNVFVRCAVRCYARVRVLRTIGPQVVPFVRALTGMPLSPTSTTAITTADDNYRYTKLLAYA
ncbi:MAG: hypothetical protein WCG09_09015 [Halobacteriota archaeon]